MIGVLILAALVVGLQWLYFERAMFKEYQRGYADGHRGSLMIVRD